MKSMIMMAAVPLAALAGGYAAGLFLVPSETVVAAAEPEILSDALPGVADESSAIPPAPQDPQADAHAAAEGADTEEPASTAPLLKIGRLTVPVLKPRSITYVVADIALAMPEESLVDEVEGSPETMMRMRDAVLASLTEAASTPAMAGPAIDTAALSERVLADLVAIGMPVSEVLFPNLFKQDVARQDVPQRRADAGTAADAPVTH